MGNVATTNILDDSTNLAFNSVNSTMQGCSTQYHQSETTNISGNVGSNINVAGIKYGEYVTFNQGCIAENSTQTNISSKLKQDIQQVANSINQSLDLNPGSTTSNNITQLATNLVETSYNTFVQDCSLIINQAETTNITNNTSSNIVVGPVDYNEVANAVQNCVQRSNAVTTLKSEIAQQISQTATSKVENSLGALVAIMICIVVIILLIMFMSVVKLIIIGVIIIIILVLFIVLFKVFNKGPPQNTVGGPGGTWIGFYSTDQKASGVSVESGTGSQYGISQVTLGDTVDLFLVPHQTSSTSLSDIQHELNTSTVTYYAGPEILNLGGTLGSSTTNSANIEASISSLGVHGQGVGNPVAVFPWVPQTAGTFNITAHINSGNQTYPTPIVPITVNPIVYFNQGTLKPVFNEAISSPSTGAAATVKFGGTLMAANNTNLNEAAKINFVPVTGTTGSAFSLDLTSVASPGTTNSFSTTKSLSPGSYSYIYQILGSTGGVISSSPRITFEVCNGTCPVSS